MQIMDTRNVVLYLNNKVEICLLMVGKKKTVREVDFIFSLQTHPK